MIQFAHSRKKIASCSIIFVFMTMLVSFLVMGSLPAPAQDNADQGVAIKVDGETLSKEKFSRSIEKRVKQYQQRMKKAASGKQVDSSKIRQRVKKAMKKRMVDQLVLKSHAEKSNVSVSKSEVDKRWKAMVKKQGGKKKVLKKLKQTDFSEEEFKEQMQSQLLIQKYLEQELEKPTVTDQEVRDYYNKRKKKLGKVPFQKAKPYLKKRLKRQKFGQLRQEHVRELRKESSIQVNVK